MAQTAQTAASNSTSIGAQASALLAQDPAAGGPSANPAEPPEAQGAQAPATFDGFKVGDFTFKPGGRIKLDVIRDFKPIGSEDSFDTRTIPVDGSEGTNSNIHAKESRISLDISGPVPTGKQVRMYVEGDFYGTSGAFRLRQAYGDYGGLRAGQTWSTFVDEDNFPFTLDFESPTAFASIRQGLVRWTQKAGPGSWSVAVEDNKSSIVSPNIPGKPEYPLPDFVGRYRVGPANNHIFTAIFFGEARYRPAQGATDDVSLWGWVVSGRKSVGKKDAVYGIFTIGDGIGRYRGAVTAYPDEDERLQAVGGTAFTAGYEHYWNDTLMTHAVYSIAGVNDEPYYATDVNKQLDYGAVNLIYWFIPGRAWTGVEYLYGRRETFGPDTPSGTAHRIQYSVRFNLP